MTPAIPLGPVCELERPVIHQHIMHLLCKRDSKIKQAMVVFSITMRGITVEGHATNKGEMGRACLHACDLAGLFQGCHCDWHR
jgi:hypothetical protein